MFCPRCGASLPGAPPTRCAACGYEFYLNPRPTGSVIILDGDRFLAMLRVRPPRAGFWDLPGGFCDAFEHPADAAMREAREELGVTVRLGGLAGMFIGSYDYQGETLPVLDCFYLATIVDGTIALDPAEGSSLAWLPLADPPELAFLTAAQVIATLAPSPL